MDLFAFLSGRMTDRSTRKRSFRPETEVCEPRSLLSASAAADVLTYHNSNARTGADPFETALTPANVNPTTFGAKFTDPVDGAVYAQPLYMANVSIPGQGVHNVVFVATQHDSVYAFDADKAGPPLWQVSFIKPAAGITSVPTLQDWQDDLAPEIGITGTPVIDPSTGTLYVVAKTQVTTGSSSQNVYTLHALDISTGAEKMGGPVVIQPSVPGRGEGQVKGVVPFNAYYELQRPALLLENGVVFVAFGSLGGHPPYHGWVVGYAANNLQQVSVFNTTPNSNDPSKSLGGIWMDGEGPAADAAGNIYLFTGSGPFKPARVGGNWSDAALKLTPSLQVADYFAPQNTTYLDQKDLDLGSGGAILVPTSSGSSSNLLVGGGKVGTLFAINTASMGHQTRKNPNVQQILNAKASPTGKTQTIAGNPAGAIFSSPAYSNGMVYINAVGDVLRQYAVVNGKLIGPVATSSQVLGYPGANLSVSSNGASDGIVWSLENSGTRVSAAPAVLHAYNAANVGQELYNSNEAGTRDQPGAAVKFAVPTVANGKVYVGTKTGLTVYGLLNS